MDISDSDNTNDSEINNVISEINSDEANLWNLIISLLFHYLPKEVCYKLNITKFGGFIMIIWWSILSIIFYYLFA